MRAYKAIMRSEYITIFHSILHHIIRGENKIEVIHYMYKYLLNTESNFSVIFKHMCRINR